MNNKYIKIGLILCSLILGTSIAFQIAHAGDLVPISRGGGGSGSGTFSTSTSQVSGQLTNHPNNNSDIVTIGSSATSSAKFYFDPNTSLAVLTGLASLANASSTQLTVTGATWLTGIGSLGGVSIGSNGKAYSSATTTAGTGLTYSANAFNVNASQSISTLSNLTSNGFVKTSGGTGALSVDTTSYVPTTRTLTINGTAFDLSADRSWTISSGGGTGTVSTSSSETAGQIAYFTSTNGTPALLGQFGNYASNQFSVANAQGNASAPELTATNDTDSGIEFIGNNNIAVVSHARQAIRISDMNNSGNDNWLGDGSNQNWLIKTLSGNDRFDGNTGALTLVTPLVVGSGGTGSSTLGGVLKGNGTSAVQSAVNGTDFTLVSAQSCGAGQHISALTAAGGSTCSADSGGGGSAAGTWASTTSQVAGQIVNYSNNNSDIVSVGSNSTTTDFAFLDPNIKLLRVNGSVGTTTLPVNFLNTNTLTVNTAVNLPNGSITNANLANSTISGVALGGTLNGLSAFDSSLTISLGGTYDGSGVRTIKLNTANQNSWSVLQTFANASSTAWSSIYASSTDGYFGNLHLPNLSLGGLAVDSLGNVYKSATSTLSTISGLLTLTSQVTGVLPIANGGTNASSFTTSGNAAYYTGSALATAPLTSAVTTPYASSTAISAPTICLSTDCRTAWPSAGGGAYPFQGANNSTSTITGFTAGLYTSASSTLQGTTTFTGNVGFSIASTTSAATQTVNWQSGITQRFLLTANTNFAINATSSSPADGGKYILKLCQDGTGSRTVSFITPGQMRWSLGTTTVASGANQCTWIGMIYDAYYSTYTVLASTTAQAQ